MAGLSPPERAQLAVSRATQVLTNYGSLLNGSSPRIVAAPDGLGVFRVTVSYDLSGSAIMRYGNFVPLPTSDVRATVAVTNGGY